MNLPKKYLNEGGKYPAFLNRPKISYSQHSSWKDLQYRPDYIIQYFSNIKLPSGCFAEFGSEMGRYLELKGSGFNPETESYTYLTDKCIKYLSSFAFPENCVYEDEIVVDIGGCVLQGFTDRTEFIDENTVGIKDWKTGNLTKKREFYASSDYGQSVVYAHAKVLEGKKIKYCHVELQGRKGNNTEKHPLRLEQTTEIIDTPYSPERAQEVIADIRKSAEEISALYTVYQKYFV